MIQVKEYSGIDGEEHFGTLYEIAHWMAANEIPLTAQIYYAGCGSHRIAFQWDDGEPTIEVEYEVYVEDVENPSSCWGWTQDTMPDEATIQDVRIENPGRHLEITWKEVRNVVPS